ncbi:ParA family protein [Actinomyces faecalis]|uniref:AAA family ATPase n=1 Tax=Actinomyces faecalis TaxID=2722820 RepID=UPI0015538658
MQQPLVLVLLSTKGRTEKTTSSVYLGAAMARLGRQVLLRDLDPQGSMPEWCARAEEDGPLPIAWEAVNERTAGRGTDKDTVIVDCPPGWPRFPATWRRSRPWWSSPRARVRRTWSAPRSPWNGWATRCPAPSS